MSSNSSDWPDSETVLANSDGWSKECSHPLEIIKMVDGVTLGYASGEAAYILLKALTKKFRKQHKIKKAKKGRK